MKPPRSLVVLTGAGISQESGLATFRAADGLWEGHRLEEVCTPQALAQNAARVNDFYNQRRRRLCEAQVQPNAAHHALAAFEKKHQGSFLLITQNVDDLHERAGSSNLLHLHGELLKVRCRSCESVVEWRCDVMAADACPHCGPDSRGFRLRPHIVFFGEMPFYLPLIEERLGQCDVFIAIGTSGVVYPAAGFSAVARAAGARCVELNLEPSACAGMFHEVHTGPATRIVPEFLDRL